MSRWLVPLMWRVVDVTRNVAGAILTPGGRPDKRRLEPDAPAFSCDAGDASPLAGDVLSLLGRALSEGFCYIVITALMDF